jgi:putative flippase GtrA
MRQPIYFLLVGGMQYLIDTLVFALLISSGLATVPANVASRASAAAAGFLSNRYWTFSQRPDTLRRFSRSLVRFLAWWLSMTVVSSLAVLGLESILGDEELERILAKVIVEAVLAVISFLVSRYWVYRS